MPRKRKVFEQFEHLRDARARDARDLGRLAAVAGQAFQLERSRRSLGLRDLATASGLGLGTVQAAEAGRACSLATYVRLARTLGLRLDLQLASPRRKERATRQADPVHAAMGEIEAAHFRSLGYEVRLDEPYQHFQFAGRADVVAWSAERAALLHIENKTEFADLQDLFGSFNAKRAYLGAELGQRAGVRRWASETHVIVALWSADVLRFLRRHRTSFESVCPNPSEAFEAWWSGEPPEAGRHATFVIFDPVAGKRADRRRWVGLERVDEVRPRHTGYADAARALR